MITLKRGFLIGIVACVTSACGGATDLGGTAGAGPGPGNGDRNQPGSAPTWERVIKDLSCSPPNNAPACIDAPFQILADGRYQFVGTSISGRLNEAELSDLDARANSVVRQDFTLGADCEPTVSIPEISGERLTLNIAGDGQIAVVERSPTGGLGRCVRGEEARADSLDQLVTSLMAKYYPGPG